MMRQTIKFADDNGSVLPSMVIDESSDDDDDESIDEGKAEDSSDDDDGVQITGDKRRANCPEDP